MQTVLRVIVAVALLMSTGTGVASALPPGGTFIDDDGSVHEGSVEAIYAAGLTVGCSSDRYCPDELVTRAQMAVFLLRAIGHDRHSPAHQGLFEDVAEERWYGRSVEHFFEHGFTRGCTPTRFCPDAPVTRGQMATFLVRVFELPPSTVDRFDDDDVSVHAADIEALAAAGITVGCAPDRFCPDAPVARDQMATFLTRALDLEPVVPEPGFYGAVAGIDAALRDRMSSSWRPGCPVPLSDLRYLSMDHWGFDGHEQRGEMVVHEDYALDVLDVFETLFDERFPVARMSLVDDFGGDDLGSMEANNTSAFNCRLVQGGSSWSEHAYGRAIDINPVQNPYHKAGTVLPESGERYLDRSLDDPGMIHAGDEVVSAFDAIGWEWGGNWVTLKDWQHFSSTGR